MTLNRAILCFGALLVGLVAGKLGHSALFGAIAAGVAAMIFIGMLEP